MNTYFIMFLVIVIVAGFITRNDKLLNKIEKILRAISLIAVTMIILWLVSVLLDIGGKEVSAINLGLFTLICIAILALINLMNYATYQHSALKKFLAREEYKFHLIKRGAKLDEVEKRSNDLLNYKSFQQEAEEWAKSRHA